jgi:hypothetical protein
LDFLHDVGVSPGKEYLIDRINNNGIYEPGNVRWATRSVQNRNKRNNVYLTINGETLVRSDWETKLNLSHGTIARRVKLGWTIEEAAFGKSADYLTIDGVIKTRSEWALEAGISNKIVKERLKLGWTDKEAVFGKNK